MAVGRKVGAMTVGQRPDPSFTFTPQSAAMSVSQGTVSASRRRRPHRREWRVARGALAGRRRCTSPSPPAPPWVGPSGWWRAARARVATAVPPNAGGGISACTAVPRVSRCPRVYILLIGCFYYVAAIGSCLTIWLFDYLPSIHYYRAPSVTY